METDKSTVTWYGGIDPGQTGALCLLRADDSETIYVDYFPWGVSGYCRVIRDLEGQVALIGLEEVHSLPRDGVVSAFTFGTRYGELLALLELMDVPYIDIRPQDWRKGLGIGVQTKKAVFEWAQAKGYVTDHLTGPRGGILTGRCDALAIAYYTRDLHESYGGNRT